MTVELAQIVSDFAAAMEAVDQEEPQARSHDGSRLYKPGIGAFTEDAAVALTLARMQADTPGVYDGAGKRGYPGTAEVCDLAIGELPWWAIEAKIARVGRDNGTYEDTAVKKILSPYEDDRSAVTDCVKLCGSEFAGRRAVLIFGFENTGRPLRWLIDAFELVVARHAVLGARAEAHLTGLVHPIHAAGAVYAWEVL